MTKIIRYGIKDNSGWYYVEDHTHILGRPEWFIFNFGHKNHLFGLIDTKRNKIRAENIKKIEDFIDKKVAHFQSKVHEEFEFERGVWYTGQINQVIKFKD